MKFKILAVSVLAALSCASSASAWEPGWWGVVIAKGDDKARIEATPILQRPYRPFHFYGNTVRRQYYRGHAALLPRDVVHGAGALVLRRQL